MYIHIPCCAIGTENVQGIFPVMPRLHFHADSGGGAHVCEEACFPQTNHICMMVGWIGAKLGDMHKYHVLESRMPVL